MKKLWVVVAIGSALLVAAVGVRALRKRPALTAKIAALAASPRAPQKLEPALMLYDGKLGSGWDDWGWGPHQLGNGPAQVQFAGFGGILLHHAELPWQYGGVSFRYKAKPEWGEFLHVSLRMTGVGDDSFPTVIVGPQHVLPVEEGFREVFITAKELNPERRPFDRLQIGAQSQVDSDWVLLDKVMLTKPSGEDAASAGDRDEALRVVCDGSSTPISELIYGSSSDSWSSGHSAKRMGGNPLSRLNWELGAWNTGKDWYFENHSGKQNLFEQVAGQAAEKHYVALVVPMLGWVAKDNSSFGFPKSKFPQQAKFDPYRSEAGDGMSPQNKPIAPGPPELTSIPAPPELIGAWIRKLLEQDKARGWRGVHMYILDNEPSLWNETHRDVHPHPLNYDELLDRTIKYATAIRDADPEAVIAGPAEWGWIGYMYSAVDREAGTQLMPDRRAHGGMPLVPWYLRRLAEHEKATGKRLLDVLDLHFYPAQDGVFSPKADPTTVELRLRSTRSLWDADYRDESWIADRIRLIPRMKEWVRDNYPGRKLSLGEWNFGAEDDMSGALATAEALGRFGQQGLDAAFHWGDLKENTATYWAFRVFRNFDSKGARFEDLALPVKEAKMVSLFASRDAARKRLVLVLINREPQAKITAKVALQGCGNVISSRRFDYPADAKALAERPFKAGATDLSAPLPPHSISVVELKL